jgi:hypothetical protein
LDILGLLSNFSAEIGRFFKHNYRLWLGLLRDPVDVLKKNELGSDKVLYYSLGFAAFIYLVCLAIALPPQFVGSTPGFPSPAAFVVDAITQFVGFASIGAALWISGRVLGARSGLVACLATGFFMTAVWPVLQLGDWVLSGDRLASLPPGVQLALFGAVFLAAIAFALYWAVPIVAHVHTFGRARAILATLLQILLVGAIWVNVVQERFPAILP